MICILRSKGSLIVKVLQHVFIYEGSSGVMLISSFFCMRGWMIVKIDVKIF